MFLNTSNGFLVPHGFAKLVIFCHKDTREASPPLESTVRQHCSCAISSSLTFSLLVISLKVILVRTTDVTANNDLARPSEWLRCPSLLIKGFTGPPPRMLGCITCCALKSNSTLMRRKCNTLYYAPSLSPSSKSKLLTLQFSPVTGASPRV